MSNLGRTRVNLKPCAHCKSTERDSNGQCHCRNLAYREAQKAKRAKAKKGKKAPATKKAVAKKAAKPSTKKAATKKAVAKKAAKPRKAATKAVQEDTTVGHAVRNDGEVIDCTCGFAGKGTLASIRSHVSRANKGPKDLVDLLP